MHPSTYSPSQVPWHELPASLLQHILTFLDISNAGSLSSVQLTCHCWRSALLALVAWQSHLELVFSNPDHVLDLCDWYERYCIGARCLRVYWHPLRIPLKLRTLFWQKLLTTPRSANLTQITSSSLLNCVHSPCDYTEPGYCDAVLSALTQNPKLQLSELDFLQEWRCTSDWGLGPGVLANLASKLTCLRSLHIKLEWQKPCDRDLVMVRAGSTLNPTLNPSAKA